MKIPTDRPVFESEACTFWFNEEGILCCLVKEVPNTLERVKEAMGLVHDLIEDKKVCILVEATALKPFSKEAREYVLFNLKKLYKAIAFVTQSLESSMVVNIFLNIQKHPVPTQKFDTEEAALEWLRTFTA